MSDTGRQYWDALFSTTPAAAKHHCVADLVQPYEGAPLMMTVFVSCYNEENTIVPTLATVCEAMDVVGASFEILVIDDASQDASVDKIRAFMEAHPERSVVLRVNRHNKGLAQNYYDAAFIGRGKYFRLVRGNDCEPVETMVDVLRAVGEADIVVPYFVSRGRGGWGRRLLSRCYTRFVNLISGNRINYYTGSHIHLRANVMRWHSATLGFSFQVDLLCRLLALGFTCKQVPCRAPIRASRERVLTLPNALSLLHTTLDILLRRLSMYFHGYGR